MNQKVVRNSYWVVSYRHFDSVSKRDQSAMEFFYFRQAVSKRNTDNLYVLSVGIECSMFTEISDCQYKE